MEPSTRLRLRAELEDSRREIVDELRRLGADPDSSKVRRLDDVDDNFADSASATQERAEALLLIDQFAERLADVDQALERIDTDGYGMCERCGRAIPDARMEARPMSVDCVDCAAV